MKTTTEISKHVEWDYYYNLNDSYKWIIISESPAQLSEEFMEEFFDKLDWPSVIHFKKVSCEFIEKHYKYFMKNVGILNIVDYQYITVAFIDKHYQGFNKSIYNFDIWRSIIRMNKHFISKDIFIKYMPKGFKENFEMSGEFK